MFLNLDLIHLYSYLQNLHRSAEEKFQIRYRFNKDKY